MPIPSSLGPANSLQLRPATLLISTSLAMVHSSFRTPRQLAFCDKHPPFTNLPIALVVARQCERQPQPNVFLATCRCAIVFPPVGQLYKLRACFDGRIALSVYFAFNFPLIPPECQRSPAPSSIELGYNQTTQTPFSPIIRPTFPLIPNIPTSLKQLPSFDLCSRLTIQLHDFFP